MEPVQEKPHGAANARLEIAEQQTGLTLESHRAEVPLIGCSYRFGSCALGDGHDDRVDEAQLQVATYRLLVMLREFDDLGGWAMPGLKSCAHWLSWRTGLDAGAAREKLRVAPALAKLPLISESMSKGDISYSKVRAVTRVATPENDTTFSRSRSEGRRDKWSASESLWRAWRKIDLETEKELATEQQARAELSTFEDEDGMLIVRAKLPPDIGAVFLKALDAASDVVYRKDAERPLGHRRAEALKLISEASLASELDMGNSADRYQVVVHVDEPVLEAPEQAGPDVRVAGVSLQVCSGPSHQILGGGRRDEAR